MEMLQFLFPMLFLCFAKEGEGVIAEPGEVTPDTEKTEDEVETGEVEKTPEPSDEDVEKGILEKGEPIPFERFKEFVTKRNDKISGFEGQIGTLTDELEGLKETTNNPLVYKAILQAQGITDPKIIEQKLKEGGFDTQKEMLDTELIKQFAQGLDLSKQENWFIAFKRMAQHFSGSAVKPLEGRISSRETTEMLVGQEPETRKVSELYGVKYGNEKEDAQNPKTGVGILAQFLIDNPQKKVLVAKGELTKAEALILAFRDTGHQLGKQQGKAEADERNEDLKSSAMEEETIPAHTKLPSPDAPVSEIMDFARKNVK